MKKNVLITGASGFVGRNLQEYFGEKFEISTISLRYIPGQSIFLNSNAVIHLSGKAHDLKKVANPKDYYEANFELTKQLFDSFLNSDASVFIFMSTVKAVADDIDVVFTEEYPANPKTHYGIAKHQAEQYILSKEIPYSKRVYILRPCMIHGPENKGNLNLLYQLVSKGFPWPLGAFHNQRSFLSVENLCFVIKELLENEEIPSGIYNVADDKPLSTNELIKLMANTLDKKAMIWNINTSLVKSLARMGDNMFLPLNSERLQKLTENYVVSNKKIVEAIGKSLPIKAEIGLIKTFQSFIKNKK